ncbi:MAG: hypothetical protein U0183_05005 [Polyangiaceae bacterium]
MAGLDPLGLVGLPLEGGARAERALSESSWSSVYRAVHGGKPCVLRAFPGLDPEASAACARDVERLASNGAGTPSLVAHGVASTARGEVPYVVTEWVDGPTLAAELDLRTAAYPLAEVASLASALRRPFTVAHELGIVHGDVGPSALHLDKREKSPVLRIVDFGVARALARVPAASPYEPRHAAPEVVDSSLGAIGPEADVFALALTFMEALLPRLKRKTGPLAHRKKKSLEATDRPTPKKLGLDLPPKLAEVLERAVASRPSERFPDVVAFFDALAAVDAQFHVHVGRRGVEHTKPPASQPASPKAPPSSPGGSGPIGAPPPKVEASVAVAPPLGASAGPEAFRTRGASDPPPPVRRSVPPGRGIEAPLTFLKGPSEPPPALVAPSPLAAPAVPRDLVPPSEAVPSELSPPVSSGTGKRRAPMGLASQSGLFAASAAVADGRAAPEVTPHEPAAHHATESTTATTPAVLAPPSPGNAPSGPETAAPAPEMFPSAPEMSPSAPEMSPSAPGMSPGAPEVSLSAAGLSPSAFGMAAEPAPPSPGPAPGQGGAPAVGVEMPPVAAVAPPVGMEMPPVGMEMPPVAAMAPPVGVEMSPVAAVAPPVVAVAPPVDLGPSPARPPTASMLEEPPLPPMESSRGLLLGAAGVAVLAVVVGIVVVVGGRSKPEPTAAEPVPSASTTVASAPPSASVVPSSQPSASPSGESAAAPSAVPSAAPPPGPAGVAAFDAASAKAALDAVPGTQSECRKLNGPRGKWKATVTFEPSGAVSDVELEKPFSRTPAGKCVRDHLKGATVPAFGGSAQKVTTLVTIAVSGK